MNKLFITFFYAFCGLLLALCISLIISTNVWLEMRIHERLILEVCVVGGIIYSFFRDHASITLFCMLQSSMFLLCLWFSKIDLIYYSIRNVYLYDISIATIRIIFLGLLTSINGIIIYHILRNKSL